MVSINSTNGLLRGVIYAVSSESENRISPLNHWMANGICNAFFVLYAFSFRLFFKINRPSFPKFLSKSVNSSCVKKRFGRHKDTIIRKSRRMPLLNRPTGTPLFRVSERIIPTSSVLLEMPMGAVYL